jgi:hypothetical protein
LTSCFFGPVLLKVSAFFYPHDFMKHSLFVLISAAIALVFGACDQHTWEDTTDGKGNPVKGTKALFETHHEEGGHGGHGEGAAADDKGHHEDKDGGAADKAEGESAHP